MEYKELKEFIQNKGLKLNFLASQLDMSRFTLANKLNGVTEFTVSEANRLAEILEIEPEDRPKFFLI